MISYLANVRKTGFSAPLRFLTAIYVVTGETVGKPINPAIHIPAHMAQEASLHSFSEIPTTYGAIPILPEIQIS